MSGDSAFKRFREVLFDPLAEQRRLEDRIASLGQELLAELPRLFPSQIGFNTAAPSRDPAPPIPTRYAQTVAALPAPRSGYLREIDGDRLMALAAEYDLVIHMSLRPGAFLLQDAPIAHAHPASRVSHEARQKLIEVFHLSDRRFEPRDSEAIILQLVQIACRALSSGQNDPITASACIDWLGAGLRALTGLALPSPFRSDSEGILRVVARSTSFRDLAELSFSEIRHHSTVSPTAVIRLFEQAAELARFARRSDDRRWLSTHIQALQNACRHYLVVRVDQDRLDQAWKAAAEAVGLDPSGPPPDEK